MLPDARMRVLASEPAFKLGEFGVHGSLLLRGGYHYETEEARNRKYLISLDFESK